MVLCGLVSVVLVWVSVVLVLFIECVEVSCSCVWVCSSFYCWWWLLWMVVSVVLCCCVVCSFS